jgi:hypothetical protein
LREYQTLVMAFDQDSGSILCEGLHVEVESTIVVEARTLTTEV